MIRALLCEPPQGTQERAWLKRKMLAWFPLPFQLVNKLNLRLPQIAVADEKWIVFPFFFLHPRCASYEMLNHTQSLGPLCPSTGLGRAMRLPEQRTSLHCWESTSCLDFLRWKVQKAIWKVSPTPNIYHIWKRREGTGRDWNNPRKQEILWLCRPREQI